MLSVGQPLPTLFLSPESLMQQTAWQSCNAALVAHPGKPGALSPGCPTLPGSSCLLTLPSGFTSSKPPNKHCCHGSWLELALLAVVWLTHSWLEAHSMGSTWKAHAVVADTEAFSFVAYASTTLCTGMTLKLLGFLSDVNRYFSVAVMTI